MAMEGIYNVPEFRYNPKVEKFDHENRDRRQHKEQQKKKKKKDNSSSSLFDSLADSLNEYGDKPFQFNG